MADIKKVLMLLCKQIKLSTGIDLTPNYFRLAKYNKQNNDMVIIMMNGSFFYIKLNKHTLMKIVSFR